MSEVGGEEAYTDNVVGGRFGSRSNEAGGSGGGGYGLSDRVTRLEEGAKNSEARMSRMEEKLDQILQRLAATPTRIDLLAAFAAALGVLGIVFAGLGWLETRAARMSPASQPVAPLVLQLPVVSPPPASAHK